MCFACACGCDWACSVYNAQYDLKRSVFDFFFCSCLLCDWYICQYLCRESGNVHVFVLGTVRRGACKNICTTSHSCYANVCCAILRQNKQSGIELTKRHLEDKMHQAQAGVHRMAMTSKAEDLNYLSDATSKKESGCLPTGCFINCIFDGVSQDSENWCTI